MNQPLDVEVIVRDQETSFLAAVTDNQILWEKECEYAMQALRSKPALREAALKNPESLRAAITNIAAIGISLNPMLKHAYMVPRREDGVLKVCLDISYQGLLDLAVAEGSILWGQAKLVHEQDTYRNVGIDAKPDHIYEAFAPPEKRGLIIGVYCTVKTLQGDYLTEEMDMSTLNQIRAASKAANGPWKDWFGEMAKKAVIKRASKTWPNAGLRLATAVHLLNQEEGNRERDITPISESETVKQLTMPEDVHFVVDGKSIDEWLSEATTEDMFNHVRTLIRDMPEGSWKEKVKQEWIKKREAMRAANGEGDQ